MLQMNLLAGQDRDADVENGQVDTGGGKGDWDELGEGIDVYVIPFLICRLRHSADPPKQTS